MLSETNNARKKRFMLDFAVNPRGELWKKDEQNFGCKLMKKMGWKKGDGLGKNANGITQPIRLVQTHENEGLGYSKHTSDYSWNWLSHQDDYDTLLDQLKEQHTTSSVCSSFPVPEEAASHQALDLEKKSKKSRKRVHYKRAIQGKDLSNRSAADWQCILGKKKKQKYDSMKSDEPMESEVISQEQLLTSVVTSNKYFMEKRLKLEAKSMHIVASNLSSEEQVELDCESSHSTHTYVEETYQQPYDDHEKKKRKKRKKKKQLKKSPKEVDFLEDEPMSQAQDVRLEKENRCQAEDSLLVLRKAKRKMKKKKKRAELKTISDLNNLDENNDKFGGPKINSLSETLGLKCILKKRTSDVLQSDFKVDLTNHQKKHVRFMDTPIVGYVPRKDSVRGGAWVWKMKFIFQAV